MSKPIIFLELTAAEYSALLKQVREQKESGTETLASIDRNETEARWTQGLEKIFPPEQASKLVELTRHYELHAEVAEPLVHRLLNADRQPIDDDGRVITQDGAAGPELTFDA